MLLFISKLAEFNSANEIMGVTWLILQCTAEYGSGGDIIAQEGTVVLSACGPWMVLCVVIPRMSISPSQSL